MTADEIETRLRAALAPQHLQVQDDSHLHAGHAGAREGRHFTVHNGQNFFPPVQRPYPPLYFGGSSPAAHELAAKHVVLATGTASGKSLGYLVPVLGAASEGATAAGGRGATAIYLAPTKALAADQLTPQEPKKPLAPLDVERPCLK